MPVPFEIIFMLTTLQIQLSAVPIDIFQSQVQPIVFVPQRRISNEMQNVPLYRRPIDFGI